MKTLGVYINSCGDYVDDSTPNTTNCGATGGTGTPTAATTDSTGAVILAAAGVVVAGLIILAVVK
jgi:hypothetical protein